MELGQSKFQIGDNHNLVDWTYVENAAHAHLLASDKLTPGGPVAGEVKFHIEITKFIIYGWISLY